MRNNIKLVFLRIRVIGGATILREILGQPFWSEIADFEPIMFVAPQP